jgi:hypothetical protein
LFLVNSLPVIIPIYRIPKKEKRKEKTSGGIFFQEKNKKIGKREKGNNKLVWAKDFFFRHAVGEKRKWALIDS